MVSGFSGVRGFEFFEGDRLVCHPLPYTLRSGDERVMSRWNMARQKLTVSRVQCVVRVLADGTATLESALQPSSRHKVEFLGDSIT